MGRSWCSSSARIKHDRYVALFEAAALVRFRHFDRVNGNRPNIDCEYPLTKDLASKAEA